MRKANLDTYTEAERKAYRHGYHNGLRTKNTKIPSANDLRIAAACLKGVACSCNDKAIEQIKYCVKLIEDTANELDPKENYPVYGEDAFTDEEEREAPKEDK